ncbi:MAG: tRNA (N(6)-L-threonylcarbamoyladenosine(37)-C(2))-methylthiotransferase [Candidatus Syntropharchaeales archaeon]
MRFYIRTFGCTANNGDSKRIEALLEARGGVSVDQWMNADTVVVNTCTVTKRTELNVIRFIKKMQEANKTLILAGCMTAVWPDTLGKKKDFLQIITPRSIDTLPQPAGIDGVIGVVNIAQGCLGDCTYCIVKGARGDLVSAKLDDITSTVRRFVDLGMRELRVTSQDCSAYGRDGGGIDLSDILKAVSSIEGDFKVRVGMMNPDTLLPILDDVILAFKADKIFKFVHIPVQSGSDRVLAMMRRGYTAREFELIVDKFRSAFDDMILSTDFIVGTPYEREEDFEQSVELLKRTKPEKVNITRFSPRPGTPAAAMADIPERVKKDRSRRLTKEYRNLLKGQDKFVGKVFDVIATQRGIRGGVITRDDAYRYILVRDGLEPGEDARVKVTESRAVYLVGEVV